MIKVMVVSTEVGEEDTLLGGEAGLEGDSQDQALEMGELVDALIASLAEKLKRESKLSIEMSGSVKVTGSATAGAKFLCFNVGGSGARERTNTLTISLETTIEPAGTPATPEDAL